MLGARPRCSSQLNANVHRATCLRLKNKPAGEAVFGQIMDMKWNTVNIYKDTLVRRGKKNKWNSGSKMKVFGKWLRFSLFIYQLVIKHQFRETKTITRTISLQKCGNA